MPPRAVPRRKVAAGVKGKKKGMTHSMGGRAFSAVIKSKSESVRNLAFDAVEFNQYSFTRNQRALSRGLVVRGGASVHCMGPPTVETGFGIDVDRSSDLSFSL